MSFRDIAPALVSLPGTGRQQRQGRQSFGGEMMLQLPGASSWLLHQTFEDLNWNGICQLKWHLVKMNPCCALTNIHPLESIQSQFSKEGTPGSSLCYQLHVHRKTHTFYFLRGASISRTGCDEYKFSIRTNIRIYLYPKNDTNEYIRISEYLSHPALEPSPVSRLVCCSVTLSLPPLENTLLEPS